MRDYRCYDARKLNATFAPLASIVRFGWRRADWSHERFGPSRSFIVFGARPPVSLCRAICFACRVIGSRGRREFPFPPPPSHEAMWCRQFFCLIRWSEHLTLTTVEARLRSRLATNSEVLPNESGEGQLTTREAQSPCQAAKPDRTGTLRPDRGSRTAH